MPNFPDKLMTRVTRSETLGNIFEVNAEGEPRYFNHKIRTNDVIKYRIPEHQRYPQWNKEQKNLLIDTIFRNFPMSGVVVSQHVDVSGKLYFDIEDGQSRLSNLQGFYMNEYPYKLEDGNEIYFKDIPRGKQRAFENYQIYIEEISDVSDYEISEAFERLQFGMPLKDKDLYWNRKVEYPYVSTAIALIDEPYWLNVYMNTEKKISDKNRGSLPDIVTFIYAMINFNKVKAEHSTRSTRKTFWKSFRSQIRELNNEINVDDKRRIKEFLTYLNAIITAIYTSVSPRTEKPKENIKTWGSLARQTGLILYEWLENEGETHQTNQEKWIQIMQLERRSGNFMFKGNKTMWNGLKSSHKQNTDDDALDTRLSRVNEFFNDPEGISKKHGISYNENDYSGDSSDEDSTY
jgi:hypothetical protein